MNKGTKRSMYITKKIQLLWQDNRNYKTRLIIAFIVTFAMCFTFVFFGPVELTTFGQESLSFGVFDIVYIMAGVAVAALIVISLLVSMLHGKIFNYIVTGIFSLTLCGYIQGNFLNGHLGALTGDAVDWHLQRTAMLINLLIWLIIFIIPYIVLYLHKKGWGKMIVYVSAVLVIMQTVALITLFVNPLEKKGEQSQPHYLTTDEIVEYSQEKNTIVFLLDRLDYNYIEQVLADDSHFFDKLDGFTSYTNAISEHARTRPAANYMLTNCDELLYKVPAKKYFEDSWTQENNILEDFSNANFKTNIYTQILDMFGSGNTVDKYVSNLSNDDKKIDIMGVTSELFGLSIYRYAPTSMKPFFWTYTDYVNKNAFIKKKNNERYEIDETKYMKEINKMTLSKSNNYFKFYHFNGSHPPYVVKEDGTKSSTATSVVSQTKGNFNILFKSFQKMKELGIYKDASIIIVADHGYAVSDKKPLSDSVKIGMFYKPSGSEGIPLVKSNAPVSLKNIPATLLKSSGIEYKHYGIPLDEVKENSNVTRFFYKTVEKDGHERELYKYQISGDASDFRNWKKIGVDTIKYPFY